MKSVSFFAMFVLLSVVGCATLTPLEPGTGIYRQVGGIYRIKSGTVIVENNEEKTVRNFLESEKMRVHVAQSYNNVHYNDCFGELTPDGTVTCEVYYTDPICYKLTGTMVFNDDGTATVDIFYQATLAGGAIAFQGTISLTLVRLGGTCEVPSEDPPMGFAG